MALVLVVPVVCPFTGDLIDIPPEELTELEDSQNGVIEVVCPTCGAGGRIERFVVATVVAVDQVETEDTTRMNWGLTQRSTTAVTTVKAGTKD